MVVMVIGIWIVMVKVGGGEVVVGLGVVGDGIERKLKRRGFVMREFRGGCDWLGGDEERRGEGCRGV